MDELREKDKSRAQKAADREAKRRSRRALRNSVQDAEETYQRLTGTSSDGSSDVAPSSSWSTRSTTPTPEQAAQKQSQHDFPSAEPFHASSWNAGFDSTWPHRQHQLEVSDQVPSLLPPSPGPSRSTPLILAQIAREFPLDITEVLKSDQEAYNPTSPPVRPPSQPSKSGPSTLSPLRSPDAATIEQPLGYEKAQSEEPASGPSTEHNYQHVSMPEATRRRRRIEARDTSWLALLWKATILAAKVPTAVFQCLWAWRWVIGINLTLLLTLLWIVGTAIGTVEVLRDSSVRALCGPMGRPILKVLGTYHICLPPPKLPEDPFGTERVASFITIYMPQLSAVPEDLATQKLGIAEVVALIRVNEKLMFPKHGKNMVHLVNVVHQHLGQSWRQAIKLRSISSSQMALFTLKMKQTATETTQAVAEIDRRGQTVTVLAEIFSRLFYFLTPFTKHHQIIETFVFHIEDTLPKLASIIKEAETLHSYLEDAKINVLNLNYYLKEEHKDFESRCNSYSRFFRPDECRKWLGRYRSSFEVLEILNKTISETAFVLERSTQQLTNAEAHIDATQILLRGARSTLSNRWDVKILLSEVDNILLASQQFQKLVISGDKWTIVPNH